MTNFEILRDVPDMDPAGSKPNFWIRNPEGNFTPSNKKKKKQKIHNEVIEKILHYISFKYTNYKKFLKINKVQIFSFILDY